MELGKFYCGAVFALAMNHVGHNLIQHVQAHASGGVTINNDGDLERDGKMYHCPDGTTIVVPWTKSYNGNITITLEPKCAAVITDGEWK